MPVLLTVERMLLSVVGVECGGIVRTASGCTSRDAGVWGRQEVPQRRHRAPSLRRRHIQLAFHTRISRSLRCVHLQQLIKASIENCLIFLKRFHYKRRRVPSNWLLDRWTTQSRWLCHAIVITVIRSQPLPKQGQLSVQLKDPLSALSTGHAQLNHVFK